MLTTPSSADSTVILVDSKTPKLRSNVKQYIATCPCCQKMSMLKLPIHAHPFRTSHYYPMEALNIDFIGPFLDKGYVMTIIDTFTRWVELHHSLAANVKSVANIYSNILEDLEPLLSLYQTGGHTLLTK